MNSIPVNNDVLISVTSLVFMVGTQYMEQYKYHVCLVVIFTPHMHKLIWLAHVHSYLRTTVMEDSGKFCVRKIFLL